MTTQKMEQQGVTLPSHDEWSQAASAARNFAILGLGESYCKDRNMPIKKSDLFLDGKAV